VGDVVSRVEVPEELRRLSEKATPGKARTILPGDLAWSERRKYRCFVLGPNDDYGTSAFSGQDALATRP
jgi:hypothetical protein